MNLPVDRILVDDCVSEPVICSLTDWLAMTSGGR